MTGTTRDELLARFDRLIKTGQIAAGAAHEINNLLAPLLWHLELLDRELNHVEAPTVRRHLDAALDSALRIRAIAQDTLWLARHASQHRSLVDLNDVITDACRLARPTLQGHARLVVETERVPRLMVDGAQLVQLVLNLILNALDAFEEPGPRHNEVRLRLWPEDDSVCLEVRDNGRGIPADVQERVFEAFYTTRLPEEGAGLGLWVCHDIAQRHHGTIVLESRVGRGTCVQLRLPLKLPDHDEEQGSSG